MSLPPGSESIADDELLYRRIPVSKNWYSNDGLSPEAFDPRDDETTGISFYRAKYVTIEQAARGLSKKGYYVASFRASDLAANGIIVVPRPEADDPGHAELPDLRFDNREADEALGLKHLLAELPESVKGPFIPQPQRPPPGLADSA